MRKTILLLTAAIAASLAGCRPHDAVGELFTQADIRMDSEPDSVLRMLQAFDAGRLRGRGQRARYALLLSRALDKNYIDLTSDSLIAPAVAYFARHGSDREKAQTRYYLGRIRNNAGEPGEAARLMLEAAEYAERAGETYLLGMTYSCRGSLYYSQYSFEEAVAMFDKAESCCRAVGKIAQAGLMLKAKAKAHTLMEEYDIAASELNEALTIFDSIGNKQQVSVLTSSLASMAFDRDQSLTDSLKNALRESYARNARGEIPRMDYRIWSSIYLAEGKTDSARYYATQVLADVKKTPNLNCAALILLSRIEEQARNYRQAARYWNQSYALFDSITHIERKQLIQQVEKRYQNQQLLHRNELLQLHNRLLFCIGALIFAVVTFSLALLLKHRHQIIRRKTEEIARYRGFIQKLQEDYIRLQEQYEQLAERSRGDSLEEANLLKALEKRLTRIHRLLDLAYSGECKPQAFYKAFKETAQALNREDGAFSDLQYLVNKRNHGVVDYLRKTYPTLTNSELDMLSMILFGFTFDGIRLVYNHDNVDSIYSRRTKIREKLRLPPRTRIEKYLETLVEELKNGTATEPAANA